MDDEAKSVSLRAELAGVAVRPEDLPDVVQAWRLIAPHLALVGAIPLGPEAEPASLFRP